MDEIRCNCDRSRLPSAFLSAAMIADPFESGDFRGWAGLSDRALAHGVSDSFDVRFLVVAANDRTTVSFDRSSNSEGQLAMDPLSEVLRAVRLTGGVFLSADFTAPWSVGVRITPEDCAPFLGRPAQIVGYHV